MSETSPVDEGLKPTIVGHLMIRDPDSGEVFLNKRDTEVSNIEILKEKLNASD